MKTVLCFGDSNTWGYEPGTGLRYDESTRWTSLTPMLLENKVSFYEAGLNGRTTNSCDTERDFRRGTELLKLYLESCRPLSLVIINLGTNDLKKSLQLSVEEIQSGARLLCKQALEFDYSPYDKPQVMLVAPAPLVNSPDLDEEFEQLELENSRKLASEQLGAQNSCSSSTSEPLGAQNSCSSSASGALDARNLLTLQHLCPPGRPNFSQCHFTFKLSSVTLHLLLCTLLNLAFKNAFKETVHISCARLHCTLFSLLCFT